MDLTYYKRYEPIFGEWHIVREIGKPQDDSKAFECFVKYAKQGTL